MSKYLIAFDNCDLQSHNGLSEMLADWGAQHLLDSVWLADLPVDASAVIKALKRSTDQDAAFAVFELKPGADWTVSENVYGLGYEWLRGNF